MAGISSIGGMFLRASDPEALYVWYERHLGLTRRDGCFVFPAQQQRAHVVVAFFPAASDYFPVRQPAMLNFQVENLDAVLDQLAADGAAVDPKREQYDYGRFGWFTDPEGNRVELWQP